MKLLIMQSPATSSSLGPNILLSTLLSSILNICFALDADPLRNVIKLLVTLNVRF